MYSLQELHKEVDTSFCSIYDYQRNVSRNNWRLMILHYGNLKICGVRTTPTISIRTETVINWQFLDELLRWKRTNKIRHIRLCMPGKHSFCLTVPIYCDISVKQSQSSVELVRPFASYPATFARKETQLLRSVPIGDNAVVDAGRWWRNMRQPMW